MVDTVAVSKGTFVLKNIHFLGNLYIIYKKTNLSNVLKYSAIIKI
jgi:hypothetical protein